MTFKQGKEILRLSGVFISKVLDLIAIIINKNLRTLGFRDDDED